MKSHGKLQRKQLRAMVQRVSEKLAGVTQGVNMHAFGFSLALACSLTVAGVKRFSTVSGTLDRALKLAVERGAFAPWKDWLRFVDTSVGMRCVQLQEVLTTAQMAGIISFIGPAYNEAEVGITGHGAQTMLKNNALPEETAKSWGEALVTALAEV